MADWTALKTAIASVIKTNSNQEITGQILQNALNSIISNLGENDTFVGIALPTTIPGTPDGKKFYIAHVPGNYVNFGLSVLFEDDLCILRNQTGSWTKTGIPVSSSERKKSINISQIYPTNGVDNTDVYTLSTAIGMVPNEYRIAGLKCSFITIKNNTRTFQEWQLIDNSDYGNMINWQLISSTMPKIGSVGGINTFCDSIKDYGNYSLNPYWGNRNYKLSLLVYGDGKTLTQQLTGSLYLMSNGNLDFDGADSPEYYDNKFERYFNGTNWSAWVLIKSKTKQFSEGKELAFKDLSNVDNYSLTQAISNYGFVSNPIVQPITPNSWILHNGTLDANTGIVTPTVGQDCWYIKQCSIAYKNAGFILIYDFDIDNLNCDYFNVICEMLLPFKFSRPILVNGNGNYKGYIIFNNSGADENDFPTMYQQFNKTEAYTNGVKGTLINNTLPLCTIKNNTFSIIQLNPKVNITDVQSDVLIYGVDYFKNGIAYFLAIQKDDNAFFKSIKWNAIGDSITAQNWMQWAVNDLGIQTMRNYGIGGNRMAGTANSMAQRYVGMDDDANLITVMGGTNDFGGAGTVLENVADKYDITTIKGAVRILAEGLQLKYPRAIIFWIIPPMGQHIETLSMVNGQGLTQYQQADAIISTLSEYGIPYVDCLRNSGINLFNMTGYPNLLTGNIIDNKQLDDNGLEINRTNGFTTNFIDITGMSELVSNVGMTTEPAYYYFYDSNHGYLTKILVSTSYVDCSPYKYMKISAPTGMSQIGDYASQKNGLWICKYIQPMMVDRIHPSIFGQKRISKLFIDMLKKVYTNYL